MKKILIAGAWPYANGSLHIGHIAALLPGDILARYYRAKGNPTFYVSGSDCYGTPIMIRAKQENKTPAQISDFYHDEFNQTFEKLGFSYDLYTKTGDLQHADFVRAFHKKLYEGDYIHEKTVKQGYCTKCKKILVDRLVVGQCPVCGEETRGDQCDHCNALFEAESLMKPRCVECQSPLELRESTQLYIAISKLETQLTAFLAQHPKWRKNAIAFTKRYIDAGLQDRAITRDIDWGIDVPKEGYEDKKIYIWAENVLGYLSASARLCDERNIPFAELWGENARHYYVHGKDNIPFHTIILPSLLIGQGEKLRLPDDIVSTEHLTLEGRKISTSQNWAIWAKDIADQYNPDSLRYFLIANSPEKRDADFSLREFVERNNTELVGAYGNLVNRTLAFIAKYLESTIPIGIQDDEIKGKINAAFQSVGEKIEEGNFKNALGDIFELVRFGNKYYDTNTPWKTRISDPNACGNTLFNCVQIIVNLSVLLAPFLPFSSERIFGWLGIDLQWRSQYICGGYKLPDISILFDRLDISVVDYQYQTQESR